MSLNTESEAIHVQSRKNEFVSLVGMKGTGGMLVERRAF